VFFRDVVSHNRDFLEAQSMKGMWIEVEWKLLYSKIERAQARLERTEFQPTLLFFQLEDRKREREE
ncbi:Os08g0376900, partial [Oryza sativa Japonica Group]